MQGMALFLLLLLSLLLSGRTRGRERFAFPLQMT